MNKTQVFRRLTIAVLLLSLSLPSAIPGAQAAALPPGDGSLLFVENVGQWETSVRFQARLGDQTLWLTDEALWLAVVEPRPSSRPPDGEQLSSLFPWGKGEELGVRGEVRTLHLRLSFPDANPHPRLEPFGRQDVRLNYYLGNDPARWRTDVPAWSGVRYRSLYPGVDLELYGQGGRWAWRLVESGPGPHSRINDPAAHLQVEGADPQAAARYLPAPKAGVTPQSLRPQDTPGALHWSTFLGGSAYDRANGVAVRHDGAVCVTGATFSSNLPTPSGWDTTLGGNSDAFVACLKPDGSGLLYATFLGGDYTPPSNFSDSMMDRGNAITVDGGGAAYITGHTFSHDFPTTAGAYDTSYNGGEVCVQRDGQTLSCGDAFVARLNAAGQLTYSTFLGGSYLPYVDSGADDNGLGIALGPQGRVYVTGWTNSWDFPTTSGAYKREFSNVDYGLNDDMFLTVLNPAGGGAADLLYSTYIGGAMFEQGEDLAVDGNGNAYVVGTYRRGGFPCPDVPYDFPTTPNAFDSGPLCASLARRAFMLKFYPGGQGSADLRYATLFGPPSSQGSAYDASGYGIALDGAGHPCITGNTENQMPTTTGAYDPTFNGGWGDVFVACFNPAGGGADDLLYATYLGGSSDDSFWDGDIAVDAGGDLYITGDTYSTNFPTTPDAFRSTHSGVPDVFVTRLRPAGQDAADLIYSTYVGGSVSDYGYALAVPQRGVVMVAGQTQSTDFPTTAGALDTGHNGDNDAFVFRMYVPPVPDLSPSTKTVAPEQAVAGEVVTFTVRLVNSGRISATVRFTDTLPVGLQLQGTPTASSGPAPAVNGQALTWQGVVTQNTTITITYAAQLTATVVAVSQAQIDDGRGNVYTPLAFVNGRKVFLPLVLRNR